MGKLTAITVAALLVIAIIAVATWGNELVHLVGLGVVVIVICLAFWRIDKTLEKHPQLALLDGAEIIKVRELELAAKNTSVIPVTPITEDPTQVAASIDSENEAEEG